MVDYGPWTQDPDYTTDATYTADSRMAATDSLSIDRWPGAYADQQLDSDDGPIYIADGSFMELFSALADNQTEQVRRTSGRPDVTYLERRSQMAPDPPLPLVPYNNFGIVNVGHTPYPICYEGPTASWKPGEWPTNAVGIEWQNHPEWQDRPFRTGLSTRVGATLLPSTELQEFGRDAKIGETYVHTLALADIGRAQEGAYYGEGATGDVVVLTSSFRSTIDGVSTATLGMEIDLTPHLDLTHGGVLFTTNDTFVPAADPEPYNMHWDYGARLFTVRVRQAWRPPVYRWVYDSPAAYRRTFPRDDSLAGGAGRNYPPSRAIQSSNRIGGGYL